MTAATDHYDRFLAAHYTWMLGGDIAALAADQLRVLSDLGVRPATDDALAVDLGCGPGTQSLALAELGFSRVLAVDTSEALLSELADRATDLPAVRPLHADIRDVLSAHARPAGVAAVVCMGDTLTHLPSKKDVTSLLADVSRHLVGGGRLVLTYRDLTTPLTGTDRFLQVRATENRVMTCFLEYVDEDTVMVHDLIHARCGATWALQTSSYPKLRISSAWLSEQCRAEGLDIQHSAVDSRGLHTITAIKP
ncbi:class I SAM-dependent methyltransferase [Streptomyces sclerotialus]|uniref:class I SAM-dependent methyltransferase n=1 Tax=Streptomyces sclerotialus TaxID=1957 RepID=UPI0004C4A744